MNVVELVAGIVTAVGFKLRRRTISVRGTVVVVRKLEVAEAAGVGVTASVPVVRAALSTEARRYEEQLGWQRDNWATLSPCSSFAVSDDTV